jgi:hypothetical protein
MSDSFGNFPMSSIDSFDKFDILDFVERALNNPDPATFNLSEDTSNEILQDINSSILPSNMSPVIKQEYTLPQDTLIHMPGNLGMNDMLQNNPSTKFVDFSIRNDNNNKNNNDLTPAQTTQPEFTQWDDEDPDSSNQTTFTSVFLQQQIAQHPRVYLPIVLEIEKLCTSQYGQLEEIRLQQTSLFQNPMNDVFQKLLGQQKSLKESFSQEYQALQRLKEALILTPHDLFKVTQLMDVIALQNTQLDLYIQEIQAFLQHHVNTPLAALVIQKQPFPNIFMKRRQLTVQEVTIVKLLKSACVEIQQVTPCRVAVICNSPYNSKTKEAKPILNVDSASFDSDYACKWQFTFQTGTRKDIATVQFAAQIQCGNEQIVAVKSDISRPFLVITNECQYGESLQILFVKDVFANRSHVPWNLFANELVKYFLIATRQDLEQPIRSLSTLDLNYLHFSWFRTSFNVR